MTTKKIKPKKNSSGAFSKVGVIFLRNKFFRIFLVVLLAYFQTLFMYFWNDDNAVIFKLQHLNEGMGNLGSGIFGFDSPYRMVIFPLIPIYYLFGINSIAFFAYGLLYYFFAAVSVYFFAKSFLKDNGQALIASLIFSSGLIGAESLWRVYNSVHTSITIIYILLFVIFYNYFIAGKKTIEKIIYYFLSVSFFYLAIQWGYVRAHGIIFIVLTQDILFNFSWRFSLLRMVPFLYFSYIWYFAPSINTKHVQLLLTRIFENYELELLLIPLKTLKNILMPDIFNFPLAFFAIILLLLLIRFKSKIFFFSLAFIISSYLTYYAIYHDLSLNTTHRYLTTALPGVSLLATFILSKAFKDKRKFILAASMLIIINLCLINWIQFKILKDRSIPTKNFFTNLKKQMPSLRKNSIVYFDVEESEKSVNEFRDFFGVGSMPNTTAIAIYYSLDRYDLFMPESFDDLIKLVNENKVKPEDIYTFFYDSINGLQDTSHKTRQGLWKEIQKSNFYDFNKTDFQFASPARVFLTLTPSIKGLGKEGSDEDKNFRTYLDYSQSKELFYRLVSVKSDTEWQNYSIDKIVDRDYITTWMASRGTWHDLNLERIDLDLGEERYVGAIKIKFSALDKTPVKYTYECSIDKKHWQDWPKIYYNPRGHAETKIDLLSKKKCRFVKITLEKTAGGDSPEIAEIEVIEPEFMNLDFMLAEKYEDNLAEKLTSKDRQLVLDYIDKFGLKVTICFITNEFPTLNQKAKSKNCQKKQVKVGKPNDLELVLPQGGTILRKIIVLPQTNVDFKIGEGYITPIPFKDLQL